MKEFYIQVVRDAFVSQQQVSSILAIVLKQETKVTYIAVLMSSPRRGQIRTTIILRTYVCCTFGTDSIANIIVTLSNTNT